MDWTDGLGGYPNNRIGYCCLIQIVHPTSDPSILKKNRPIFPTTRLTPPMSPVPESEISSMISVRLSESISVTTMEFAPCPFASHSITHGKFGGESKSSVSTVPLPLNSE